MSAAARIALPHAGRWRRTAVFALALSAFTGLVAKSAFPEPAPSAPASTEKSELPPGVLGPRAYDTRGLEGRALYRALIEKEVASTGLPADVADAVMSVESSYNPATIGGVGEIGLMQLLPSTARMLGFSGTLAELAVPETNIHYGVMYLAQAWRLAHGDICTATMKYRAGHGETRFSYRSVNYCVAVRTRLFARGYPVTGIVPTPTSGEPTALSLSSPCRRNCLAGTGQGRVNLDAINSKLNQIVIRTNVRAVGIR